MGQKAEKGKKFIVNIQGCQNATWQGFLTNADDNKTIPFRSALELLKLMNEAVRDQV